jgi:hypothetical protein
MRDVSPIEVLNTLIEANNLRQKRLAHCLDRTASFLKF